MPDTMSVLERQQFTAELLAVWARRRTDNADHTDPNDTDHNRFPPIGGGLRRAAPHFPKPTDSAAVARGKMRRTFTDYVTEVRASENGRMTRTERSGLDASPAKKTTGP
jgi:hypothetical protein